MTAAMTEVVHDGRVASLVGSVTKNVYRRYRRWATWNDIAQEQWLWLCANPDKALDLMEVSETQLWTKLRAVAERYARKEKAATAGYREEDEYFYTIVRIAELLPDALDPAATTPKVPVETRSVADFGWMEWETGIADVRAALAQLPATQRAVLTDCHVHGIDVDPDEYRRALRGAQRVLGGARATE